MCNRMLLEYIVYQYSFRLAEIHSQHSVVISYSLLQNVSQLFSPLPAGGATCPSLLMGMA